MRVVHVANECAPIYKTGGLGDVVGSLPFALHKLGVETAVIIPDYGFIKHKPRVLNGKVPVIYAQSKWFTKPNPEHDHKIQAPKYAHFALVALQKLTELNFIPDIIHCHDWHASLIAPLIKSGQFPLLSKTKVLLTLHNIAFQGRFPKSYVNYPELALVKNLFIKSKSQINFLKEGIQAADFISTVSPNHAREIRKIVKIGFGLNQVIKRKRGKFVGILNGIDYAIWKPKTDSLLKHQFNRTSVFIQKPQNKAYLQKLLGLPVAPNLPVFGYVARLSQQKGIDLVIELIRQSAKRPMQIVILGKGGRKTEAILEKLCMELKGRLSINLGFNESLAHQIYASSDFFLMPSYYEPCGLTQMISMRYGTLPIASAVGGLKDSIKNNQTGFLFSDLTAIGLMNAVDRALTMWQNEKEYRYMVERAMRQDFSWKRSAKKYIKLYNQLLRN